MVIAGRGAERGSESDPAGGRGREEGGRGERTMEESERMGNEGRYDKMRKW